MALLNISIGSEMLTSRVFLMIRTDGNPLVRGQELREDDPISPPENALLSSRTSVPSLSNSIHQTNTCLRDIKPVPKT
ncbi:hypothetical protein TNCV_2710541 [Trichonephila clavipes]|nr:hypothetical protein TNCV_2710541 [Trichonephila clavipes]